MSDKICVVVGVGPMMGEALARAFGGAGYRLVLMARTPSKLAALAEELGAETIACDVTDDHSVIAAFAEVADRVGPVHTVLWNVGSGVFGTLDDVGVDGLELAWRTNVRGLFVAAQQVTPAMRDAGDGAILVTGATASRRGKPFTTAFAAGKAAQRSLCQSLARQLGPEGIHVALMILDAVVAPVGAEEPKYLQPTDAAQTYLHVAQQPRSTWTFELELRPSVESW